MNIQYASDLHLEFPENKAFLKTNPLKPEADILLLAGDIVPFAAMDKYTDFFSWAGDNFQTVYWIPGNHEYYYSDAANRSGVINEKIKSNVFLINNQAVETGNVRLILSTLWSNISPVNYLMLQRSISDFQVIEFNKRRFSPDHFNQLHQDCLKFLTTCLNEKYGGKTVVVTHHVPTFIHYPEKYKSSNLNEAFAVELRDLIETTSPDYWIFGHHHHNTDAFKIGHTCLTTNQLGYVKYDEHIGFNQNAYINL